MILKDHDVIKLWKIKRVIKEMDFPLKPDEKILTLVNENKDLLLSG